MRLAGSPASTFNSQPSKPKVTARRASWATASSTRSSMFSISAAPAWARAEQAGRDRVKEHQGFLDGTVATGATSKSVCVCVGGGLSCTQRRESRVTMKSGEGGGGGRKGGRQARKPAVPVMSAMNRWGTHIHTQNTTWYRQRIVVHRRTGNAASRVIRAWHAASHFPLHDDGAKDGYSVGVGRVHPTPWGQRHEAVREVHKHIHVCPEQRAVGSSGHGAPPSPTLAVLFVHAHARVVTYQHLRQRDRAQGT
jgi:hypothetical protein